MTITAEREIEAAADAAQCVVRAHERLIDFLQAGRTLAQIDERVAEILEDLDCVSAFHRYKLRGYPPFPSHACLSVNDCIVHGTHDMTDRPLAPGDLISIDIGVKHQGWIGDAAWTYAIEYASEQAQALMDCGRESLRLGIEAIKPGRPLVEWARAVQGHVERECGFHLVRGLGGHGYGHHLHSPPYVSNVVPSHMSEWPDAGKRFDPGMLLAVEPMIAIDTGQTASRSKRWPIFTKDGSLAVHYEADVIVTDTGCRDLTEGMDQLPDIVGV